RGAGMEILAPPARRLLDQRAPDALARGVDLDLQFELRVLRRALRRQAGRGPAILVRHRFSVFELVFQVAERARPVRDQGRTQRSWSRCSGTALRWFQRSWPWRRTSNRPAPSRMRRCFITAKREVGKAAESWPVVRG